MAITPEKVNFNNLNEIKNGDGILPELVNAPLRASAYAQEIAESVKGVGSNQPNTMHANEVGETQVLIETLADGTKRLVFANLKGQQGEKGQDGEVTYAYFEEKVTPIKNQTEKNSNLIKGLYSGLIQKGVYKVAEDVQISETTQITGGSELSEYVIVDNSYATIDKISGNTIIDSNTLKNTQISGVKSVGRNLIPYPYKELNKTINGITFTTNADGSVSVSGKIIDFTHLTSPLLELAAWMPLKAGDYVFVGGVSNVLIQIGYTDKNGKYSYINANGQKITFDEDVVIRSIFVVTPLKLNGVNNETVYNNITVYPMLNVGDTAIPYELYKESVMTLPQMVELGKWDYIENGKLVKQTSVIVKYSGEESEGWNKPEGYSSFEVNLPSEAIYDFSAVLTNKDYQIALRLRGCDLRRGVYKRLTLGKFILQATPCMLLINFQRRL